MHSRQVEVRVVAEGGPFARSSISELLSGMLRLFMIWIDSICPFKAK